MSDIVDGGAVAPTEGHSAPIEQTPTPPAPIRTEPQPDAAPKPDAKPAEPAKPVSTRDALAKAKDAIEKRDGEKPIDKAGDKAQPKPADAKPAEPAKDARSRAEDGKFAAKADPNQPAAEKPVADPAKPAQRYDAPQRFSPEAKVAWEAAPDAVKAETHRFIREVEQGFEKHREAATAYEPIRHYDQMARQQGQSLDKVLDTYVGLENMLREDPIKGLEKVCENLGLSLRDVASHVMGQSPDEQASQSDATIRELRGTIDELRQQVSGVTGHIQTQKTNEIRSQVTDFADKNPRFDELSNAIAKLLSTGMAEDLPQAYEMADRLNPAPAMASAPAPVLPAPKDLTAQTQKGGKSIHGAPSTGSNPDPKTPAPTVKEALKRAMAKAG